MSGRVPLSPKRTFEVMKVCLECPKQTKVIKQPYVLLSEREQVTMSVCPNQIKVKHPYVLVHQGKKNSTYIQMFPKTIPVSGYQSVDHKIFTVPLQELMLNKPRIEYVMEEFVVGLFSPFVMHPALREAASTYGVPEDKKDSQLGGSR